MTRRIVFAAALVICAGVVLSACKKEDPGSGIVGEWKCSDVKISYDDRTMDFDPTTDFVYILRHDTQDRIYSPETDREYWSSINLTFNEDGSGTYHDEYLNAEMEWEQKGSLVTITLRAEDEMAVMELTYDGRILIPAEDYTYSEVYGYHVGEKTESVSEWSGQDGKPHITLGYYVLTR